MRVSVIFNPLKSWDLALASLRRSRLESPYQHGVSTVVFILIGLSIAPRLVAEWPAIQFHAIVSPLRHEPVHQGCEAIIVMPHKEMRHLVDDDVLKTMLRFFCKLGVKANCVGSRVAASPLSLHLLHVNLINRYAH